MRKSLLIYSIPLGLIVLSPFLPDSGHDSRDVPFLKNLAPNLLPLTFWLIVLILITRLSLWMVMREAKPVRGFEVKQVGPLGTDDAGRLPASGPSLPDGPSAGPGR